MFDSRKTALVSSQQCFIQILTFAVAVFVVNASPLQLPTEELTKEEEFTNACCETKDYEYKKHAYGKSVVDPREPDLGTVVPLHESLQYNQLIRKKYCVAKPNPVKSFCKRYSDDDCHVFTEYVKQRVIVGDGWDVQEGLIWVANGCGF